MAKVGSMEPRRSGNMLSKCKPHVIFTLFIKSNNVILIFKK